MLGNILNIQIISCEKEIETFLVKNIDSDDEYIYLLPYELFSKNVETIKKYAEKYIGDITKAEIIEVRDNKIILDRKKLEEEEMKKFKENFKVGDEIVCKYKNLAFNGKNFIGTYVLYNNLVTGFMPLGTMLNQDKRPYYKINEDIKGYIIRIATNGEFILSELKLNTKDKEVLEVRKVYLCKIVDKNDKVYVASYNGTTIMIFRNHERNKNIELKVGEECRIYISERSQRKGILKYTGIISA